MLIPDIIIAIDGYSSTGKSSFAKKIAKELLYLHLDSGAMYRGVAYFALVNGYISSKNEIDLILLEEKLPSLNIEFKNNGSGSKLYLNEECIEEEIRSLQVSNIVSPIATIPFVRDFINRKLHEFGKSKRIVMDGRDIGTTVFPEAELKIFMIASLQIRAERRAAEMRNKGIEIDFDAIYKNLEDRDLIDSTRETSPLTKAEDALELDNSYMTFEQQLDWVKDILKSKFVF